MKKIRFIPLACFLIVICISSAAQGVRDTVLIGKIISMDETPIKITHDKRGYIYHFGFYHVSIKAGSDTIHMVKIFDTHSDMKLYFNHFGYKIGDERGFVVYKFSPCDCEMPRTNGYCESGLFYPQHSKMPPYSAIFRILVDFVPVAQKIKEK